MKRINLLTYILYSLISAFLGTVIWSQFELFRYFYNSKPDDFLLIVFISSVSGLLAFRFVKASNTALTVLQITTLIIGVAIFRASYVSFQHFDILSLSTYLFGILAAITVASSLKKEEHSMPSLIWIIIISAIAGGLMQWFTQSTILIWVISILFIISKFTKARWQSQNFNQWAYGFLFLVIMGATTSITESISLYKSQKSYYDKVIFSQYTPFQSIDITEWKGQRWYYYNGINNFSTIDEWLFYEPLVHPVMSIAENKQKVLVIGGDNGIAIREILKHDKVIEIEHLTLDTALYRLAMSHELFTSINQNSLKNDQVHSERQNIFRHLNNHPSTYDIIIVDVPDPVDLELNQYYTREFYNLCHRALSKEGLFITQAGSPYFATQAYYCISNTINSAQFSILEMHNQVLTMGEWGWIIGAKSIDSEHLRSTAKGLNFDHLSTTWLNNEAMNMMLSFGKVNMVLNDTIVNTLKKPVVHKYYIQGTWDFN